MSLCDNQTVAPMRHAILDVVELVDASGRWRAGTVGTVLEADDKGALVEISDYDGETLDLISVPHDKLAPAGDHADRFAS